MIYRFFSIIIPAHNEENIIDKTLICLQKINYPSDRYEVIVVENNSSDSTHPKAKNYESANFKIYSSKEMGVSKARNFGINKVSPNIDWCIIMDADTFLKENFLLKLNSYLEENKGVSYGTTQLTYDVSTIKSNFWLAYRNITDRLFKIMHVIHIVKKEILNKEKYDEELTIMEDVNYGRSLSKHGKYFFMKTNDVITSARRFEKNGYIKMFFINIYIGILPKKILKKKTWATIR